MQSYETLEHVRRPLKGGGRVVVLDTGALIGAEEEAMLQALHSRSVGGIDAHLVKLAQKGAGNFMDTYYVGYGDKSIGDCGSTTIFIEGVSMLAAKAIQDSQLYNGQESSTRYIDFAKQPFLNPHGSKEGEALLEALRAFYLEGLATMKEALALRHPRLPDEDEKVWQRAINARAFDIMRGFLPAGAATNLAWHTEIRHAADHLLRLRNHPLPEVQDMAQTMAEALDEKYPHSFKHKRYEATEQYMSKWMQELYYFSETVQGKDGAVTLERDGVDRKLLPQYQSVLKDRPVKTEPPKFLAECGTMCFSFLLDFGSFRDLRRHRAIIQRMPLLLTANGFGSWYLEQMPELLQEKALTHLKDHQKRLEALGLSPAIAQYYIPMGYRVPCRITGDLPALIWLIELRSGISVHPTLRSVAMRIGALMQESIGLDLTLYLDRSEDRFNYKRGHHDIIEKQPQ